MPAHGDQGYLLVGDGAHGLQHLALFAAQIRGAKRAGRLHGDNGHELEQMALNHVAHGSDAVVVAGATFEPDGLGGRDLNVVDVAAVPQRLEEQIGEAKDQQVLHGLLAEVVVDAKHVLVVENASEGAVELLGGCQVRAEGFFHDDALAWRGRRRRSGTTAFRP